MISLITLNTWKCDGNYFDRLEVLYREFKKAGDVLLLQESFQSVDGKYDTTRFLAEKLNFNFITSNSRRKERKLICRLTDSYSNVSILSIYPIVNSYLIALPSNDEDGGREAIAAEIIVNTRKILIISVHLSHLRNGNDLRKQQLLHILNQPFLRLNYDAIFIGGDFNCIINDKFISDLQQSTFDIIDTFKSDKKREINYTFEKGKTKERIDYILKCSLKETETPEIIDSIIVFNEKDPELGIKASDHNGVIIWVNI